MSEEERTNNAAKDIIDTLDELILDAYPVLFGDATSTMHGDMHSRALREVERRLTELMQGETIAPVSNDHAHIVNEHHVHAGISMLGLDVGDFLWFVDKRKERVPKGCDVCGGTGFLNARAQSQASDRQLVEIEVVCPICDGCNYEVVEMLEVVSDLVTSINIGVFSDGCTAQYRTALGRIRGGYRRKEDAEAELARIKEGKK